jgi:hypothetical protein
MILCIYCNRSNDIDVDSTCRSIKNFNIAEWAYDPDGKAEQAELNIAGVKKIYKYLVMTNIKTKERMFARMSFKVTCHDCGESWDI